jgi:hypothetical protein
LPLLTNVVNGNTNLLGNAGDPVLARDNVSETIYLVGNPQRPSVYYPTGTNTEPKLWVPLWRSVDGGQSFLPPINASPDLIPGDTNQDIGDKPWIAVDNFAGTGQHNVYMGFVWLRYYGQAFSKKIRICRSLDGNGLIWETITNEFVSLNSDPQGPSLAVSINHYVHLVWCETEGQTSRLMFTKSTDFGVSFSLPVVLLTNNWFRDLELTRTGYSTNDHFRTPILPLLAANPVNGHLYLAYNDRRSDGSDRADIYFTQSTNGGTNWMLPPIRVNQDSSTNDQWQPAMAVKLDGSKLFIGWYDRRNDSASNCLIQIYGVIANTPITGSSSFATNFLISTTNFPPVFTGITMTGTNQFDPAFPPAKRNDGIKCPTFLGAYAPHMGDYDTAASVSSYFYYTWGDNRDKYTNSVSGVIRNQANIRIVRVSWPR